MWRDGRWWVVRDDADRVGWADHVRWHRGWPPGRRHRLTGLLVVVLVALPFLVLGGGITWGDQTLEQFRADATASPVCLPWILEVGHALPLSVAGWAAVLLALAVRAVRRGRYADELVRAARAGHP